MDIANGIIKSTEDNITYVAKSKLDSTDLITIAKEAKNVYYYDGNVKWLATALLVAKEENKDYKAVSSIR